MNSQDMWSLVSHPDAGVVASVRALWVRVAIGGGP